MRKMAGWRLCGGIQRSGTSHSERSRAYGSELPTGASSSNDLVFRSGEASTFPLMQRSYDSTSNFIINLHPINWNLQIKYSCNNNPI